MTAAQRDTHPTDVGSRRLGVAVGINLLLTVAQVIGGVLSGSLSLVADALHNFSDAGGLLLALVARRIARKPANSEFTFGYGRAEVVGGLINLSSIMVVSGYLLIEAIRRVSDRPEIDGWTVVILAGLALVVDAATAVLTHSMSKGSVNIKAAFLHNVADALASVVVLVTGTLVLLYDWYWTDLVATVGLSIYIVWVSWSPMKRCIRILMQSVPEDLSMKDIAESIENIARVESVAHLHVWPVNEHVVSLEVRVGMRCNAGLDDAEELRRTVCAMLRDRYDIRHATIEVVPSGQLPDSGAILEH